MKPIHPGEIWRPDDGGRWVQVLDADENGVLFDTGRTGKPGEWRERAWFENEMQPLITLGSVWRFRDGSAKDIKVVGFVGGIQFDFPNKINICGRTYGPLCWPIREFLLKAIPEARP